MASAARWKAVWICFRLMSKRTVVSDVTEPRTKENAKRSDAVAYDGKGLMSSIDTFAPCLSKCRARANPMKPDPPVTSTLRPVQKFPATALCPDLPGRLAALPQLVQQFHVPDRIHTLPKPHVGPCSKLSFPNELREHILFEIQVISLR